ncbi:hypothetical protein D3C81_1857910 [compost metagenome]
MPRSALRCALHVDHKACLLHLLILLSITRRCVASFWSFEHTQRACVLLVIGLLIYLIWQRTLQGLNGIA